MLVQSFRRCPNSGTMSPAGWDILILPCAQVLAEVSVTKTLSVAQLSRTTQRTRQVDAGLGEWRPSVEDDGTALKQSWASVSWLRQSNTTGTVQLCTVPHLFIFDVRREDSLAVRNIMTIDVIWRQLDINITMLAQHSNDMYYHRLGQKYSRN